MLLPILLLAALPIAAPAAFQSRDEPAAPSGNARKGSLLQKLAVELEASTAPFFGRGAIVEIRRRLAALPKEAPAPQVLPLRSALGDHLLAFGEIDAAIGEFERGLETATAARDVRSQFLLRRKLALAWMRFAERQNCVNCHNADSCILPLKGGALHVDRRGSENAIELLMAALDADGSDLAAIWLLNVAHMTLGSWPDGVPAAWRIPRSAFESEREMPRMFDVAASVGLGAGSLAGSSIVDDFDGDGVLDVATSSWDLHEPVRLYFRGPDGSYAQREKLGLEQQLGAFGMQQFDANDDGRLDLLMQRGGWLNDYGKLPNSLCVQQPDGTFADRTLEAGIELLAPSQVAAVADFDLDGDLDLFLGYENVGGEKALKYPCKLFRNRGDATFEDVTDAAGVRNGLACKGAAFGDYDGDGRPDLYVSNMHGPNRLFHNEGGGRFRDVALDLGVFDPLDSFACWFFDYNNDGWLDLFVTSYEQHDRAGEVCAYYKNRSTGYDTQRLFENDGHGGFRDVTVERHLDRVAIAMGCNFGDVDNDGFPDIYLATGDPEFASLWPNVLYRNDGGRRFEDVTTSTGTGHLQKGHGVSFGDLDGDGDQDLFAKLGGANADDGFASVLFANPGHGNHWITVRLIGRSSNRFGVGSRIRATIDEGSSGPPGPNGSSGGATRDVFHFVGANSSFGGNSLQAEMGLGKATRLVALEVFWPKTGKTQCFRDVPLDRVVVVDEDRAELTVLPAAPVRPLGEPAPTGSPSK